MIEVRYLGRLGNNLFQYCLGRILATELHWSLRADPIPGFPCTQHQINGNSYEGPIEELTGHLVNLHSLLSCRDPRKIRLNGFFQHFELYRPYRSDIRKWLAFDRRIARQPPDDAVVVHVRRSDYLQAGYALPFSYYEEAIRRCGAKRVNIVTDDARDPFFWSFREFRPSFFCGSALQALAFMSSARQLVMSQSTFSWWPTFLGDIEHVYAPLPTAGLWSREIDPPCLIEKDRFRCIPCQETYIPTFLEQKYQAFRLKKQHLMAKVLNLGFSATSN